MRTDYRRWSKYPYPGETIPPKGSPEPGNWPMFFISRELNNIFLDSFRQRIKWEILHPQNIDWPKELAIIEQTLQTLTPQQRRVAQFWGTAEATERMVPIIFQFANRYGFGSPDVSRVLGYFHAAINDAFVMSWFFKYLWDTARPNQYNQNLSTVLSTPRFPSYPSAHATVAGCADIILSYFFPPESSRIKALMEECAQSRLYAGVHFQVDNDEGLRLGRQIGEMVVRMLRAQNVRPR